MTFVEALMDPQVTLRTIHFIGAIIAVGAVTATDSMLMLLHFKEGFAKILDKVSLLLSFLVWAGLFILSTTGAYLIYTNPEIAQGTFFHIKFSFVTLIFLNGIILNEKVYPHFHDLSDNWTEERPEVRNFEKYAGIFAAISVIGWWTIILMVQLKPYLPF